MFTYIGNGDHATHTMCIFTCVVRSDQFHFLAIFLDTIQSTRFVRRCDRFAIQMRSWTTLTPFGIQIATQFAVRGPQVADRILSQFAVRCAQLGFIPQFGPWGCSVAVPPHSSGLLCSRALTVQACSVAGPCRVSTSGRNCRR